MIFSRILVMNTKFGGRAPKLELGFHFQITLSASVHACFSGYFTSRPALKRNIRQHEGFLQAARVLDFLQGKFSADSDRYSTLVLLCPHDFPVQAATVRPRTLCGGQLLCCSTTTP
jgi:hypothetical protein